MIKDGLWDPYKDTHMGNCAELCVGKYKFTREEQDAFALESYRRAQDASQAMPVRRRRSWRSRCRARRVTPEKIDKDEEPFAAPLEKMPTLKPAFQKDGIGHRRQLVEDQRRRGGARRRVARNGRGRRVLTPIARIVAYGGRGAGARMVHDRADRRDPEAARRRRISTVSDIDLWEINEAFAAVAMAAIRELDARPGAA